ncbi:2,5-diamino-6-(ribosylamino)-4(3H)-pyrimidinone 5'-phosphate reductase [Methanoculleus sp. FWC-SCC1]|uniref:2,5-diamino-6-(ribosylamino)-4(3H)-pyrimidinone 5'-phosphate reductase n=1 Tax=Methanoculleus frigidifontis TaxID=2584085 RepID=A0ABT8MB82_9EURY|nr:2,5-diamino-6-(ribosylamino)-4(3H)-pyrimidinone 5'-phosphate reductase [Methanoculleus sp. FWC-SCC1]MDN7025187.1 2,5-diamino-6-(ribosylamino)-4(3H)-pyrimidinone 5'-phosphate reductase [Methanoculleus sp. FWC-SCC1]
MRPYVFVNVAMSADGKISTKERRQVKISGKNDFLRVDRIKAESDAVMVGIGTVLADNPSLTVKSQQLRDERKREGKDEDPVRVVIDSHARTPPDADILRKGTGTRIIAVSAAAPQERVEHLKKVANVVVAGSESVDLPEVLAILYQHGVRRLMVEGGGTLIWSLISQGLVDAMYTYIGSMVIGGRDAPTPADGEGFLHESDFIRLQLSEAEPMDDGLLVRWDVRIIR